MNPTGGLPRRKTALEGLQKAGPTLVFDSGNALFEHDGDATEATKARAAFVLETMGKLGTRVMAAGLRDLNFGPQWLKTASAKAGVKVLSANLLEGGKKPFDGSTVLEAGGVKVGFIGLTAPGEKPSASPILPAVKDELSKLKGKVGLIVLLAAVSQGDAFQLSAAFKNEIDFVVTSSEPRGNVPAQKADGTWILGAGAKGQAIGKLELKLDGKGPFVDLAEVAREKELLEGIEGRLKEFEPRLKATTDPEAKALMQQTVTELKQRQAEQQKKVKAGVGAGSRTLDFRYVVLDGSVVDDAPLKAEVLKYEPTYAGSH